MNAPLVSVMIITYNQLGFIRETLNSALDQDYENYEIVVADDGSTDGTAEVILEYAAKYPGKVVPLVGGDNLGITGNSNRGLEACNGQYIAFMGGDDLFLPGKLSAQVKWLEADEERALCYHDMEVFDSDSNQTLYFQSNYYKFHQGYADLVLRYGTYFGATTVMIRKPKNQKIEFDRNIPIASDWLFWFEVLELQKGKVGSIDGVYARYRKHNKNITNESDHALKEGVQTVKIIENKYPHYRFLSKMKCSELYLVHSLKLLKRGDFFHFFKLLVDSVLVSRGLWFAPFMLMFRKLQVVKKNKSIQQVSSVLTMLRYRQFGLYRAKKQGMSVGKGSLFIGRQKFGSEPFLINIGSDCLITDGVRFITHDGSIQVPLIRDGNSLQDVYGKHSTFKPINVGSNVFIGVDVILLPGAKIEDDCIVAAGAIVSGSFSSGSVIAGSPAKFITTIDEYWSKNQGRVIDLSNVTNMSERKAEILGQVDKWILK